MRQFAVLSLVVALCGCPSHKDQAAAGGDGGLDASAADFDSGAGVESGTGGAGHTATAGTSDAGHGGSAGTAAANGGGAGHAGTGVESGTRGTGTSGGGGSAGGAGASGGMAPAGATMIVGVGSSAFRGRSSDGVSWAYCGEPSTGTDHAPNLLRNIAYGDGVFIAVGGDANGMVMRSLDGVHWQEDVHPTNACPGDGYPSSCTNWMGAAAFQAGVWLAAGGNGAVMRSTDGGLTWKGLKSMFSEGRMRSMGAGSGRFLAGSDVNGSSPVTIFVSADNGDHWSPNMPWAGAPSNAFLQFAYGAGTFIAFASADVASNQRACFVSTDQGDTWEPCAAAVKANVSFVHDGTQWITPASGGYASSADGKSWTMHTASNVPSMLLFDGKTWFGRTGGTIYRGASPDSFAKVAMSVLEFRGWAIGQVLDANLPVMGVPACQDNR